MQDQRRSKKNVDASEMKQKRLESKFEFSKNKREENLIKKRQVTDDVGPAQRDAVLEAKVREHFLWIYELRPLPSACLQLKNLPQMVAGVFCEGQPEVQLEATTQFRKLLSIGTPQFGCIAARFWSPLLSGASTLAAFDSEWCRAEPTGTHRPSDSSGRRPIFVFGH